jgi:excinuclease ABC subunit A
MTMTKKWIEIVGARQHNLKNVNVSIPKETLTVVTGPSGSGKSSLAFDTLFAEGQRRFMESLSTYARQFLEKQEKPDVDNILGITPTLALEQKNHTKNSRSTVGTATEIYDYLRLVYSKMGQMFCPKTGEPVKKNSVGEISHEIFKKYKNQKFVIVFPVEVALNSKAADKKRLLASWLERGYSYVLTEESTEAKKNCEFLEIEEQVQAKSPSLFAKAKNQIRFWVLADRGTIEDEIKGRFEDALINAFKEGFGRLRVLVLNEDNRVEFRGRYTDYPSTGDGEVRYPEMTPHLFSFNSPMGACTVCKGFGNILKLDEELVVPHPHLSLSQGAIDPLTKPSAKEWLKSLFVFCQKEKIPLTMAWNQLSAKDRKKIWDGYGDFPGLEGMFKDLEEDRYKMQVRVFLSRYRSPKTCESCQGSRLRVEARQVLFHGQTISQLSGFTVQELFNWFSGLELSRSEKEMGKDIVPQILSRLEFLLRVGLDYLSLSRLAKTLSGGESQRIALANQLGSRLTQTTYVLDEPSIGLHPRDTEKLVGILKDLTRLRNTVVVVEHDPDIIDSAQYLIDMGPNAGEQGGTVLYSGTASDFRSSSLTESYTHSFLTHADSVPVPMRRRIDRIRDRGRKVSWLEITGCKAHNLKDIDIKIPLSTLTCITGVSGSGKSTAIRKTLYPALAKIFLERVEEVGAFDKIRGFEEIKAVQMIDQDPIGRSPRSNPVTFMKCFDEIRSLFASTSEARKKSFHAGHFSFNVPGGRCDTCEGDGAIRVEMVFMEDLFLKCDVCDGKKFKKEVLEIEYKKKNIHQVLQMTVSEALQFFAGEIRLTKNLGLLNEVGLGYLRLGQPSNTLSGGESQRLKIARELSLTEYGGVGQTVYFLDEPTTGLHFKDVDVLLKVLHKLVERGHTVVVIEHNVDVMKSSDWIVDFGPEGGDKGGKIVVQGTPEDVIKSTKSYTSKYLKKALENGKKVSIPELLGGQI